MSVNSVVMKGYLLKYTNIARGYRLRWFVLQDGILSYYRNEEEESVACRGSINLPGSIIRYTPGSEKFEVSCKTDSFPSFWLKTSPASEANKWVQKLAAAAQAKPNSIKITSTDAIEKRNSITRSLEERDSVLGDDISTYGDDESTGPPRLDHPQLLAATKASIDSLHPLANSLSPEAKIKLESITKQLSTQLDDYSEAVNQRERYYRKKYQQEIKLKGLWQESMQEVIHQHATVEAQLEKSGRENERKRTILKQVANNLASSPVTTPTAAGNLIDPLVTRSESPEPISRGGGNSELEQLVQSALDGDDSDADDEFFEAIEAGVLPTTEPILTATPSPATEKYMAGLDLEPYQGYKNLRSKLPIENDNRPPVSLWAILKGSIGKDLSKISFPVFFNEPTSMLQRMSEDMEFSECLNAAAAERDPAKRIAFVAAFAMSNYSSTIGRIAKPFNPMLGETFEYVDLKKQYRYISEQVSHHPPISASVAQSPFFEYRGEVDARSKFMGKSFEIRPTGNSHVFLRIPKEWAPELPSAGPKFEGMVVEHYTWTKVTTSVSNFLFGSPIIDHFGEMIITKHHSDLKCNLTFKPRGWRGTGQEITGVVLSEKAEFLEIAGKWSTQLVARKIGELENYLLLWTNSEKIIGAPFNLTPFAITLNDSNQEILNYLPATDCRLRPDQHAFEEGQFELANELKSRLEDFQRSTRKEKEKRGEEHVPRWFERVVDEDTGESMWEPAKGGEGLEYWEERNRVGGLRKEGKEAVWKGVEQIFGDIK